MFTFEEWQHQAGFIFMVIVTVLLIALIANMVLQMWRAARALLVIWRASRKPPVDVDAIAAKIVADAIGQLPYKLHHDCATPPLTNDEIKALLPTAGDMSIGYYVGGRLGSPPCEQHEFPPGPHVTKTCLKCGAMVWLRECKRDFTPGDKP